MKEVRTLTLYTCDAVGKLWDYYFDNGGNCDVIQDGTLGWGKCIFSAPGLKYAVITEVYVNCWTSAHKIRFYKRLPNCYQ